jgi:hypothetical protein
MVLPPGQRMGLGATTPLYICSTATSGCRLLLKLLLMRLERALVLVAKQGTKMRNAIYQNCLALDYLLASEGGVCGKFNLSKCCLQIDDEGKAIEEITEGMTKLAHVSVQTWKGWDPNN